MNDNQIETLLRKAPSPKVPAGLRSQLVMDIHLPETGRATTLFASNIPFWRRWLPALCYGVLLLGCLIGLAIQTSQIVELRRQNKTLAGVAATLEEARTENAGLEQARQATAMSRRVEEIAKLQAQLEALQPKTEELAALRVENQQLQAQLASQPVAVPPEEDPFAALKAQADITGCINNLKQIGLAARLWANEHNASILPTDWLTMKNELNTPKILTCPGDTARTRISSWENFDGSSASYEFPSREPNEREPDTVFTRCPIHGSVGMTDGSAFRGPNLRFQTIEGKVKFAPRATVTP
jgi:hypothetical protein